MKHENILLFGGKAFFLQWNLNYLQSNTKIFKTNWKGRIISSSLHFSRSVNEVFQIQKSCQRHSTPSWFSSLEVNFLQRPLEVGIQSKYVLLGCNKGLTNNSTLFHAWFMQSVKSKFNYPIPTSHTNKWL